MDQSWKRIEHDSKTYEDVNDEVAPHQPQMGEDNIAIMTIEELIDLVVQSTN
jgi:hypothetical protein